MKKILSNKQTIIMLICFLILTPLGDLFAQGTPTPPLPDNQQTQEEANSDLMLLPLPGEISPLGPGEEPDYNQTGFDNTANYADVNPFYDPITETYIQSDIGAGQAFAACLAGYNCDTAAGNPNAIYGEGDAGIQGEYNTAIQRAQRQAATGGTQGYAYAGAPGAAAGTASTTNTQGGAALSATSCIGSQLLGKLLASTITSAVGNIAQTLIDGVQAVAGAIISVPTNELGTLKYDAKRTKEQIQLSNAAEKGTSVGFAGINALVGISWDGIAYCIVNSMIDYIARSTIAWARSGFQGNPSFIQNPGQFFKQLADIEASTFLQSLAYGTLGQNICQPFRAQIVLNIARDYTGGGIGQSQVVGGGVNGGYVTGGFNGAGVPTGQVGTNSRAPGALGTTAPTYNGVNNAGYNNSLSARSANGTYGGCSLDQINSNLKGFLGGNFNQGGWNSWLQVSQVQANNPYSTYINLSAQLRGQVQQKKDLASVELGWGRGFLSFRKCDEKTPVKDQSKCPITTPGNLIEGQLEKTLNISKDRLVLAEKFDQVIAVIVDQLISTALNKVLDVQ